MAEQVVRIEGTVPVTTATSTSTLNVNEFAKETSLHASGVVNQPGAGAVICTLTPPAGFYKVEIHRAADGNGTPILYNNAALTVGATTYTLVQVPELGLLYHYTFYANVNGSTAVSVISPAASSTGINVTASITATRMV